MDKCRKLFEIHFIGTYPHEVICDHADDPMHFDEISGDYKYVVVQAAWEAWKHQHLKAKSLKGCYQNMKLQLLSKNSKAEKAEQKINDYQLRIDKALEIVNKMARGTNGVALFAYDLDQVLKGGIQS